jgi:hypothetical protein
MNEQTLFGDVDERASFEALATDRLDVEDTTTDAMTPLTILITSSIEVTFMASVIWSC